ncbi:hypothetical protein OAB59_02735 [Pelagibacteraceae bacterium]|nr:hypothetical protein [Pelagibacteraceae bacterium]
MKYKIIFLFFLTSCINNTYSSKNSFTYSSKGFAFIENQFFDKKENNFLAAHSKLKSGTKIRITNPVNQVSIEILVLKRNNYDNFYKVLISESIAKKLNLNFDFPYVEITEIKSNRSFIAEKAITNSVERKIANKAPITKINIDNLSKPKKKVKTKVKNYSILIANFYSLRSAELLKEKMKSILSKSNYQLIYINKKNDKSYELLLGPYNTINKLKNDYIVLDESNFENLDIVAND